MISESTARKIGTVIGVAVLALSLWFLISKFEDLDAQNVVGELLTLPAWKLSLSFTHYHQLHPHDIVRSNGV